MEERLRRKKSRLCKGPLASLQKSAKYKLQENTAPQPGSKLFTNDLQRCSVNMLVQSLYDNNAIGQLGIIPNWGSSSILQAAKDGRAQFGCSFGEAHVVLQCHDLVGQEISWMVIMFTTETNSSGVALIFGANFHDPKISLDGAPCHLYSLHKQKQLRTLCHTHTCTHI